ncbi:TNF receptor-associated factor 3-like [Xenia sp. Carnegie-2017]|uniref:TNF receptor-associated factor 3-like n=1 Tax=Xenia sp. Carnegie-2017 TaxID=2897299 RepID=UPI001F047052|nr:TNF receptor-associated factor 3-like [Xenia sp. Carnegie-2017]
MPGIKIRDVDRKKIQPYLICTYCCLLLVNPMQTSCGHLFCQSCIDILFRSPDPKCPEDQEKLNKNRINPDAFRKRELKSFLLHCPSEECKWFGPYEELEDHMCENSPVVCKYCKKKIPRKDIEQHESTTCDEGTTNYEFQAIGCSYDETVNQDNVRQHMNGCLIVHSSAMLRNVRAFLTRLIPGPEFTAAVKNMADRISAVLANLSEKISLLVSKLTGRVGNDSNHVQLSVDVSSMNEGITTMERQVRDNSSTILRLSERLNQADELLARNVMKIAYLEQQIAAHASVSNQVIHSFNGTLLWKIDNFNRKRQDAINGIKTALYSPPFYSSQYGYKMCGKIYMNGDGFGKGTHLSLFFIVMKGDYDALQTWPFQKKITMMLMDQGL